MPAPEVTVVLVARGDATQVAATIKSVLDQPSPALELLVVDDGSRHGIDEVLEGFQDPRLRLIRLPGPRGKPHCWNRALAESGSPYFMIMDPGDRILRSGLAALVTTLERDPSVGLAHAYWFGVDAAGRIPLQRFRAHRSSIRHRVPPDLDYRRALPTFGTDIQALPTWRRDILTALGGFDESLGDGAEGALARRLLDRAEIRLIPEFLCCRPLTALPRESRSWLQRMRLGLRDLGHAGHRVRRLLHRFSQVQLRQRLGSSRFYRSLADRMSWWPAGLSAARQSRAPAHITYVLWRYPQLSETFIRREIHALRQAGVAVDIVADEPGEGQAEDHPAAPAGDALYLNPIDPARVRRLAWGFLRAHPLRLANLFFYTAFHRYDRDKTLFGDVMVLRRAVYLAGILRERGTTQVHAPWADRHAFLALLASRLLGIPYSVQARASEIHRRSASFALDDKLGNAAFVITNSAFNAVHLRSRLGRRVDGRLHTIYNGLDLSHFRPAARTREAHDPPRILTVGRLVEQKGFDDLLRACAILRDRGLPFRCDIIGGPQLPEDTNSYVLLGKLHRRLGLGDRVRFLGELPFSRILAAYDEADVFVLPCVVAADGASDVTPNALIEAMAMRLPVVSTPVAAIPEIVENGISGVLVPPRQPAALAEALAALLADAGLRARLGAAARTRTEERFDIDKNIRRYVTLFTPSASA